MTAGITVRMYGKKGPCVHLLHGGPGAPGYMAPLARALEDEFFVLESLQRRSGEVPLSVATHIEDLDAVIKEHAHLGPQLLVGSSWGAMLALAYAAAHPQSVKGLALIGCGTFDVEAREMFRSRVDQVMTPEVRERLASLEAEYENANERLAAMGSALLPTFSHDLISQDLETLTCDHTAHEETWNDMIKLQEEGLYPGSFSRIKAPVLMQHGEVDPHPGAMIANGLREHLPQLAYIEYARCGHYPWFERHAREPFYSDLRKWLRATMDANA